MTLEEHVGKLCTQAKGYHSFIKTIQIIQNRGDIMSTSSADLESACDMLEEVLSDFHEFLIHENLTELLSHAELQYFTKTPEVN